MTDGTFELEGFECVPAPGGLALLRVSARWAEPEPEVLLLVEAPGGTRRVRALAGPPAPAVGGAWRAAFPVRVGVARRAHRYALVDDAGRRFADLGAPSGRDLARLEDRPAGPASLALDLRQLLAAEDRPHVAASIRGQLHALGESGDTAPLSLRRTEDVRAPGGAATEPEALRARLAAVERRIVAISAEVLRERTLRVESEVAATEAEHRAAALAREVTRATDARAHHDRRIADAEAVRDEATQRLARAEAVAEELEADRQGALDLRGRLDVLEHRGARVDDLKRRLRTGVAALDDLERQAIRLADLAVAQRAPRPELTSRLRARASVVGLRLQETEERLESLRERIIADDR